MACHNRSLSLPTRSHSFVLKAEEELNKLKACVASPSLSYEVMLDALKAVGRVYECINDLLCTSSNQNNLSHLQQRRWVDHELEESVKLLDVCSTSRDNLDVIKAHIKDLDMAIRRSDSEAMKKRVRDYTSLVKKANKDLKIQIYKRSESTDEYLAVVSLLLETRDITISLLQCLFSILPKQIVGQKSSKSSFLSRLHQKRDVCKEDRGNYPFDADVLLSNVEKLENGLESLFRHMIQCRVSLLNICTF